MDWDALDLGFASGKDKAIILSENLTRDEIYELFLMFKKERMKIARRRQIKTALRNPFRIPRFLLRTFKARVSRRT